ncbi:hypothetical protein E4T80_11810 [Muribacter muris]|uniref:Uncharacterized protein n=1 Tax=Muribacter muris TaxID=67855 RepID=A0A4Y9JTH8_9PAST|nr:DUF6012 family protein [Muribacter muris]MBF0786145.1 hypothetical protein [Muribacter muris]MBF0827334.1 hypothetical protein [Muribacter muris]TFV07817.1 hypothetical protein E4T80_11810 [Muribacter muris]
MLIHLTPTFINPFRDAKVTLERLSITAGNDRFEYDIPIEDLALKRPFPNKTYYIACRKRKNKAFIGLLAHIEEDEINTFTVYEEWKTITDNGFEHSHFHYITFHLLDNKFNSVSQNFCLWQAYSTERHKDWASVSCTPKMELYAKISKDNPRRNEIEDGYYFNGVLKQRIEQYYVSTIPHSELFERGEILFSNRMPDINLDGFNLTRYMMNDEEIRAMDNQMSKEKNFLKKAAELGLPFDFCQTVYTFLLSTYITPEGFHSIFSNMYSSDTVFEYLERMVEHNLLIIDEQDSELGFDDTSFLTLNIEYDPSILVDNEREIFDKS